MVNMYRSRGEPRKAPPGEYLSCSISQALMKEAKWWFGLYYSQEVWDELLTKGCEGFPLTNIELNVLGQVFVSEEEPTHREFVEKNAGITEKLAYLIVNDLRTFGFLSEDEGGFVQITPRGEKALHGISRRIYEKRFMPEMISDTPVPDEPRIEQAQKKDKEQTSLF
ncbi:MAG: hypothetical protein BalsKO_30570 [Balneolaceae bacterium]